MAANEDAVFQIVSSEELKKVGNAYRSGAPVDLQLERATEDLARSTLDFAAGMVYVSGGTMTKLGPRRFRLEPGLTPGGGTAGDREPRRPRPSAGTGAAAAPVPR